MRNDIRCQIEKVDDLRYHLETDPERHRHRIRCLTEATNKEREALIARERRTNELKDYLAQVLVRLGDRSFLEVRNDADAECDRQLENINVLKSLYNERLRVLTELKDSAIKELADVKQKLEYSLKKSENLEEELKKVEEKVTKFCLILWIICVRGSNDALRAAGRFSRYRNLELGISVGINQGGLQRSSESNVSYQRIIYADAARSFLRRYGSRSIDSIVAGIVAQ